MDKINISFLAKLKRTYIIFIKKAKSNIEVTNYKLFFYVNKLNFYKC